MGSEHDLAAFLHRVARVAQFIGNGDLDARMINWADIEETAIAFFESVIAGDVDAPDGATPEGGDVSEAPKQLEGRRRSVLRTLVPQRQPKFRSQAAIKSRSDKAQKDASRLREWFNHKGFETYVEAAAWLNNRMSRKYNSSTFGTWANGKRPLPDDVKRVIFGMQD